MRWLTSRWPAELFVPVLVATLEAAAIAPVLAFLGGNLGGRTPWPAALALLGLLAFWSTRVFARHDLVLDAARARSLLLWLVATLALLLVEYERQWGLLGAPAHLVADLRRPLTHGLPLLGAIALALLAWRRGLSYGSDPNPFIPEALRVLVRAVFLALAVEVLFAALVRPYGEPALASARVAVPVAIVAGLLAIAAGQLEAARRQAARRAGRAPGRGGWLTFAGGAALLILIVALVIGGVLGHNVWALLYTPVITGLRLLTNGIEYLLIAVAFVLFFLLYPFFWLVQAIVGNAQPQQQQQKPQQPAKPPDFSQFQHQAQSGLSPEVELVLRGIAVVAVAAACIFVLLSALRRYRTLRPDEDTDEARESLWSRDLALAQLRQLFRRRQRRQAAGAAYDLTRDPASVREAYRALDALALHQGIGRAARESASAFAARLASAWPESAAAVADLTARYLRVRYGEQPDDADRAPVRAAWQRIRAARLAGQSRDQPGTRAH
ncbi:MAG: DUF4129 domain-containing protein [Thermomicrobiales bacterium]